MNTGTINGSQTNGNLITTSSQATLSKKDHNFQKINKQSTMLYLHHHQNNGIVQATTTSIPLYEPQFDNKNNGSFVGIGKSSELAVNSRISAIAPQTYKDHPMQEKENLLQPSKHETNSMMTASLG